MVLSEPEIHLYPVTFSSDKDQDKVLCEPHKLESCTKCDIDWRPHNELAASLKQIKGDTPPPNQPNPVRNQQVNRLREEGNKFFKKEDFQEAIRFYTLAVDLSFSRPLWEPLAFQFISEELAPVLSNRAAANISLKKWADALADAEMVTQLKRDWSKGWFRKGKALMGMRRYEEARDAFEMGLEFERNSEELQKALAEVEKKFTEE